MKKGRRPSSNRQPTDRELQMIEYYLLNRCSLAELADKFNVHRMTASKIVNSPKSKALAVELQEMIKSILAKYRAHFIEDIYKAFTTAKNKMTQYESAKILTHILGFSPEIRAIQQNVSNVSVQSLNAKINPEQLEKYNNVIKEIATQKDKEVGSK